MSPLPDKEDDMRLSYAIKFVSDMDQAVVFYRDTLGLNPSFQSPFWSEFDTGETKLALHPASDQNPAGSVQLGLGTENLDGFHASAEANGVTFTSPPTDVHGTRIARFRDLDGAEISISGG
jgi:catechol 2,3-dioxygenase-like lactoylglutathione lyase family enzyme